MSRSGYHEDGDQWSLIRWRGAVKAAIRGKRGQSLLGDLLSGLDSMENKELIADELEKDGCYCALGVVGKTRGMSLEGLDPHDTESVAGRFDIADALAREIVYINDEGTWMPETSSERWRRVRGWVVNQIHADEPSKNED